MPLIGVWYNSGMKTSADSLSILSVLREILPEFRERGIESLALFGSFAREENGVYSDIDIAVKKSPDFLRHHSAYAYFSTLNDLRMQLQKRLGRPVDLFDLDSRSSFGESIKNGLIYA